MKKTIFLLLLFAINFQANTQNWRHTFVGNKRQFVSFIKNNVVAQRQKQSWDTICYQCSYNDSRCVMPDSLRVDFKVLSVRKCKDNYYVSSKENLRRIPMFFYTCIADLGYGTEIFVIITPIRSNFCIGEEYTKIIFPFFDKNCNFICNVSSGFSSLVHGPTSYLCFFRFDVLMLNIPADKNYFYCI